jgi:peptide chain release factor 3
MKRFIDANAHRIAYDVVDAPAFLAAHEVEIRVASEQWPKIRFHAMREHAGLVFQSNPVAA